MKNGIFRSFNLHFVHRRLDLWTRQVEHTQCGVETMLKHEISHVWAVSERFFVFWKKGSAYSLFDRVDRERRGDKVVRRINFVILFLSPLLCELSRPFISRSSFSRIGTYFQGDSKLQQQCWSHSRITNEYSGKRAQKVYEGWTRDWLEQSTINSWLNPLKIQKAFAQSSGFRIVS